MAVPVAIASGLCGALFALGLQGRLPAPQDRPHDRHGVGPGHRGGSRQRPARHRPQERLGRLRADAGRHDAEHPEVTAKVSIEPADLIDDDPTWVQITAWQGGAPASSRIA